MKYHKRLHVTTLMILCINFSIIKFFLYKSTRRRTPRVHDMVLVNRNTSVGKSKFNQIRKLSEKNIDCRQVGLTQNFYFLGLT